MEEDGDRPVIPASPVGGRLRCRDDRWGSVDCSGWPSTNQLILATPDWSSEADKLTLPEPAVFQPSHPVAAVVGGVTSRCSDPGGPSTMPAMPAARSSSALSPSRVPTLTQQATSLSIASLLMAQISLTSDAM